MLDDPRIAKKAAVALVALLKREGYDGLHIDFEYLTGRHSNAFGVILRMLEEDPAMRKKTLSIAAFPLLHGEAEGHRQCEKYGCERHDSGMMRVKREDRTVYFSDAELRQNMATIAAEYQTPGTATWRVGFEQ